MEPSSALLVEAGHTIFMTHGHQYRVKAGLDAVTEAARARGAVLLLFGHTHVPYCCVTEGLSIVNPGSIGMGGKTYAVLEIKDDALECVLKTIS